MIFGGINTKRVLVVNCGSSSMKFRLLDMEAGRPLAKGMVEKIGAGGSRLSVQVGDHDHLVREMPVNNHETAVRVVLDTLMEETGAISSAQEIDAMGHRVVHGGTTFNGPALIDEGVKEAIDGLSELAPLHNPPALAGIRACEKFFPGVPQVAVFDTAFYSTLPMKAYLYSIPYEYYEKYGIRKYGFHGTSHKYVALRAAKILDRRFKDLKLITCHLGNGSSVTAVAEGAALDTSMGFTPLEGLTMGTRCGDIDPSIVAFIMEREAMNPEQVTDFLNRKCGVLGISGLSNDFRDLEAEANAGSARAEAALEIFAYDVKRYISAYVGILNGLDGLVFTAGLGENSPGVRERICRNMDYMGLQLEPQKNEGAAGGESFISTENSTPIMVIPTNEELMIAMDTEEVINAAGPA